jgi:dolichyl-diphosphooligosaccharide--protein glycosyltransferase
MSRRSVMMMLGLVAVFISALIMRVYPARYGWYLNEFDPYYDFYAAQHVINWVHQYGLVQALWGSKTLCPNVGYSCWVDHTTWYPYGRQVATSSQDGLQLTGALLYLFINSVLGIPISSYDFLIFFPVLFGSLTIISIFLLVRKIAGTAAGIFAGLIFAVSPPIIERGNLGWFKSEPLALFLTILASYFFLTVYDAQRKVPDYLGRGLLAGLLLGYANSAWGGGDYYAMVFAFLFLIVPFTDIDLSRTVYAGTLLVAGDLLISSISPRPGPTTVESFVGAPFIAALLFSIAAFYLKRWVPPQSYRSTLAKLLLAFVVAGLALVSFGTVKSLSGRYLTVIDPFLRSGNPLIASVAEHVVPSGIDYFQSYAVLIFLGGFGAWVAFRRKDIQSIYALIIALSGVYIASSFSRLMVYSSLAFAVLGAIGLAELMSVLLKPAVASVARKRARIYETRSEVKVVFVIILIAIIALPIAYPPAGPSASIDSSGWLASANTPVSVVNGATGFTTSSNDWLNALQWIRTNTPQHSVFLSWWDYGYWITVMGNRTTLADNGTINETQIALIGEFFMSNQTQGMRILETQLHRPNYVLVFVAGEKMTSPSTGSPIYTLTVQTPTPTPPGGDESKKQWFLQIGNTVCNCFNQSQYIENDGFTLTPYFWQNTILGKLFPFTFTGTYENQQALTPSSSPPQPVSSYNATCNVSLGNLCGISLGAYGDGWYQDLQYNVNYPSGNTTNPFSLVYESPSLPISGAGPQVFTAVLIYKVNYPPT